MEPMELLLEARRLWKRTQIPCSRHKYQSSSMSCRICDRKEKEEMQQEGLLNQFRDVYIIPVADENGYTYIKSRYGRETTLVKGNSFEERKGLDFITDIVGTEKPKRILPKVIVTPRAHYREIMVDSRTLHCMLDINSPQESLKHMIREFEDNVFPNAVPDDNRAIFVCHLKKEHVPSSLTTV